MNKTFRYLLIFMLLISACERRQIDSQTEQVDSLKKAFWFKDFEFQTYNVTRANNGYGKKLFIDSVNFKIYRGFFPGDSTKLIHEHQEDLLNDTAVYREYYLNGKLKELSSTTYYNRIPIKKHTFYNKKGSLIKVVDYERDLGVSFDNVVRIAEREGMRKPFEISISPDSLFWEILVWKNMEFDSITNRGIDKGLGLAISRTNGQTEIIERQRKFVY
jgi:hypothetical protein